MGIALLRVISHPNDRPMMMEETLFYLWDLFVFTEIFLSLASINSIREKKMKRTVKLEID